MIDWMSLVLKLARWGVVLFIIIYPLFKYNKQLKNAFVKTALWIRKTFIEKKKPMEVKNGIIK